MRQWSGVTPDILVLGKGLAAGYAPLAGIAASPQVYAAVMGGSGAYLISGCAGGGELEGGSVG